MSKKYRGIIFNSVTVRALRGRLAEAVRERRIRTAVVSNHSRTDVYEILAREGLSVDVVVGGFDLNRFGKYRKPAPDMMFVAAAKLGLEPNEMVCVVDSPTERRPAFMAAR